MNIIKLDPRSKLFIFLSTCYVTMNTPNNIFIMILATYLFLLLILCGEYKSSRYKYLVLMLGVSLELFLARLPENPFLMFIMIIIVLFKLYFPIILSFLLVFKTTTISEFMAAFGKMKLPQAFIIPFAVMFRFIPTVNEEYNGIRQAMSFRGIGLSFKSITTKPVQTIEYILVPLLFSCVNVMDELASASLARGLDSSKKRTCIAKVKMKFIDYLIILISIMFIAFAIIL